MKEADIMTTKQLLILKSGDIVQHKPTRTIFCFSHTVNYYDGFITSKEKETIEPKKKAALTKIKGNDYSEFDKCYRNNAGRIDVKPKDIELIKE